MSSTTLPSTSARRHDWDALRAVAMLLGILLHGLIPMVPGASDVWVVKDTVQLVSMDVLLAAIHGFRMPLFFLISGFFTAMLWRRRGLKTLLWQRTLRIFFPLAIGMFTIVPAVWISGILIETLVPKDELRFDPAAAIQKETPTSKDLFAAIRANDLETVKILLEREVPLGERDVELQLAPLSAAALYGSPEMVELLLEAGADPTLRNGDNGTPLHAAAFVGDPKSVQRLLDAGTDPTQRNDRAELPIDSAKANWPTSAFVAGLLGVSLDREQVEAGRVEVIKILEANERENKDLALGGDANENADLEEQGLADQTDQADSDSTEFSQNPSEDPAAIVVFLLFIFPVFHHLWFLYFLCWLVAAFACYAALSDSFFGSCSSPRASIKPDSLATKIRRWLILSPLKWLVLIPVTMLPQALMGLQFPTFGPDTSSGLIPIPQVLIYYAIFFGYGVIYFDTDDQTGQIGRGWWAMLPLALLVVFPIGVDLIKGHFGFTEPIADGLKRPLAVFLQVAYTWLMTFGLLGLFRAFLSRESKQMRYVSDSSYWLYLLHIPLIFFFQAAVSGWNINGWAKLFLVTTATTLCLLASYALIVRKTWIGYLLNGRRHS